MSEILEDPIVFPGSESNESAGRFRTNSRSAAADRTLRLLSTYFAAGPTWATESRGQIARADPALDELCSFVRMRVALAAGRQLEHLLRSLEGRASFQYAREVEESIGAVRGQIDLARYLRTRLIPQSPRRYPVKIIQRNYDTPENALAAYAAMWVVSELAAAPLHVIPPDAPEHREILQLRAAISRVARQPILAQAAAQARDVRRRRGLAVLLEIIDSRLEGGRIAARDLYFDVLDWARRFDPEHAVPEPGVVKWAFYDDRFDSKLFEIWTLGLLIETLTLRFGSPTSGVRPLYERASGAIATWNFGSGRVLVYFQASLVRLLSSEPRWRFIEPMESPLRGIPDLAIVVERIGEPPAVILVDPKLRERDSAPSEEIYKLLGYFENLRRDLRPSGAIIFYSPQGPRVFKLENDEDAQLLAVGVDPADLAAATISFQRLGELVINAAHLSEAVVNQLREQSMAIGEKGQEIVAAAKQHAAVEAMLKAIGQLPPGSLDPVRKTTAANLFEVWELLSVEVSTMVVSAEYFGQNAPRDADHSGPLLGLAAACERVLYDLFYEGVVQDNLDLFEESQTLGSLIYFLHDAMRESPLTGEGMVVANALVALGADFDPLETLVSDLDKLNVDYRIPAAHRDLVPQSLWVAGRARILDPHTGLLSRMVLTFNGHQ